MVSLNPGDKVGLICPAGPISQEDLEHAKENVHTLGFVPVVGKSVLKSARFFAGSDKDRVADVNEFYADLDIKALFAVRGGYGTTRILGQIDYQKVTANPKPLVGISDVTALQNAILAKVPEVVCFSGICLRNKMEQKTMDSLAQGLKGQAFSLPLTDFIRKGAADGRLVGGCLSLFAALLGTPYMPEVSGAILVLEDVHDEPYQVDRNLCHLHNAGVFDKVEGVVFGNFYKCNAKNAADGNVQDVINEYADNMPCPVAINFNYGHLPDSFVVPLGARAEISSIQGEIRFTV